MSEQNQSESIDTVKIYILVMAALCLISLLWLFYNMYLSSKYRRNISIGRSDIEKILEMEPNISSSHSNKKDEGYKEIPNVFGLFKRATGIRANIHVAENQPWQPVSEDGVVFEEKTYVIHIKQGGISRRDLVKYIYKIREMKPFLTIRDLILSKPENSASDEDRWEAEITFAHRRPQANNN